MTMHYVLDLNRLHALLPAPRNMLDAAHHDGATCKYLKEGLSLATTLMYSTGKRSFTSICVTTEETGFCQLLSQPCYYQFLTCHQKKSLIQLLKFTSVVCHMYVIAGLHRFFKEQLTPDYSWCSKVLREPRLSLNPAGPIYPLFSRL